MTPDDNMFLQKYAQTIRPITPEDIKQSLDGKGWGCWRCSRFHQQNVPATHLLVQSKNQAEVPNLTGLCQECVDSLKIRGLVKDQ